MRLALTFQGRPGHPPNAPAHITPAGANDWRRQAASIIPAVNESALPDRFVQATRALAVASLLGLIALGLVWELWLAPTGRGTLALKVLPLVLPLVGFLKMRMHLGINQIIIIGGLHPFTLRLKLLLIE